MENLGNTHHVAKSIFYPKKFQSVMGERFRICPVPGVRYCVYFHLFIDIIHDCFINDTFSSFKAS